MVICMDTNTRRPKTHLVTVTFEVQGESMGGCREIVRDFMGTIHSPEMSWVKPTERHVGITAYLVERPAVEGALNHQNDRVVVLK